MHLLVPAQLPPRQCLRRRHTHANHLWEKSPTCDRYEMPVTEGSAPVGPLDGIRVVEMTEALAGPYCAMMLGDLGADVVKIERPQGGDQARGWGPPFVAGESAYFLSVNRNKRSVALDITNAVDLARLHRLLDLADVFITNNPRMESLRKYQLDPDSVRARNPRLVYAAISGYGHTGPKAGQPGYDLIAQGEAGLMALTGKPDSGPMRFPTPMADITAGLYTAIGIQSALFARERAGKDGKGDLVDVALVDAQMTWLANVGGTLFATGEPAPKLGNAHPTVAPYQPVRARDKTFIVAVGSERIWKRFCTVLGIEETLAVDPRFAKNADRNQHREALIAELEELLSARDAADWVTEFTAAGIPAGPINRPWEAVRSEQAKARGMVVELEHPSAGLVRSLGNPIMITGAAATYRRPPPRLGEHTDEVEADWAQPG